MLIHLLIKAIGFIILIIIGIPCNAFILLRFAYLRVTEKKLLQANVFLMILAFTNLILVLNRVIPQSLEALELEDLLTDTECKFVLFTYRVSRAMSICVTSLLSCHQCIVIAPSTGHWKYLKRNVPPYLTVIMIGFFFGNIALYPSRILYGRARRNNTASSLYTLHLVYCDCDFGTYTSYILNGVFPVIREVIVVGLMVLASLYIVYLLVHHEKTIKGIRSSDRGHGKSIEYKASRAVLLLVALYVALFGMDTSVWIYTLSLYNVSSDVNDTRIFLGASYSALSPIVVIATNAKLYHGINPCRIQIVQILKKG